MVAMAALEAFRFRQIHAPDVAATVVMVAVEEAALARLLGTIEHTMKSSFMVKAHLICQAAKAALAASAALALMALTAVSLSITER